MIRSDLDDRIEENTWETNPYRIIQCSRVMNCLCAHDRVILMLISLVAKHRGQINTKITFEWVHKKFVKRVHMYYFISYTTHETISDDENCDPHTSLPFSASFVYVLLMTSQSNVDDVTITRTNVTRPSDKWYLTRYISILFTAIFTAGRVRKVDN